MRHLYKGRKLGRTTAHRKVLGRNLINSLFTYGQIVTTLHKAKEFRSLAERLITLAKVKDLHRYRQALSLLQNKKVVKKLFEQIAPRFLDRPGGYTRVIRLGGSRWDGKGYGTWAANRLGDNAQRAIFELVVREDLEREAELAGVGKKAQEAEKLKRLEKKKAKGKI